ncbi:MAG: 2'-deoxycytidine 5'-triphosphate deaminase [Rhodospirillaceae bacterium]|nr:2'-deoxycytidine 5'-triphosphate deaminase [Rhodospirillaceae bacterium]
MSSVATSLNSDFAGTARDHLNRTGILPYQELWGLIRDGSIRANSDEPAVATDQLQPASVDLRLGASAWRVPASFLAGPSKTVQAKLAVYGQEKIDLREGAVLERGHVYVVQLSERLSLPSRVSGQANPKSSAGRLDIFTRLITDFGTGFDDVPVGYEGPLYAEISPRTFSVRVKQGTRLSQVRLRRGDGSTQANEAALRRLHDEVTLVHAADDIRILRNPNAITIGSGRNGLRGLIGFASGRGHDRL